jgi:hypothetical protein
MAFSLYPEDEMRLRQRIRQIVLEHIKAQGGVLAGGVESKRQRKKAGKKIHEDALLRNIGLGYDIGGSYAGGTYAGGKKKKGKGMGTKKQKASAAQNPWLKFVKKYRKQGYTLKQISKMYHAKK